MQAIKDTKSLGLLIRKERKAQKLTQEQLAGLTGVGVRLVRELEAGKESCQIGRALQVAASLGLTVSLGSRRVCTAAYPRLAKRQAMAIGGRSIPDMIQLEHWLTLVSDTRGAQRLLARNIGDMAGRIGREADKLLAEFEDAGIRHEILAIVRAVIEARAAHLLGITKVA